MKTILVIEDNEQNLYLARFILEKNGHRVEAASNGPDGIAAALRLRPDLILLDIQLPGMDGHQVAARLRSRTELDHIPILAVTSFAMAGDRDRILAAGCTGYLEKPIEPAAFLDEVERMLAPREKPVHRPRVLVVDDVEDNRTLMVSLLSGHGFEVDTAGDGRHALELARAQPPDLVISDILMPVMDGFAFCREWRKDAALAPVPFVFYTATYTDSEDERFGLSLGAARFLIKPLEPNLLIEQLRQVLGSAAPPAEAGTAPEPRPDEETHLRAYNAILVRKLEDKMAQLESANADLERRVGERTRQLESANLELQAVSQVGTWTLECSPSWILTWSAETCRIFGFERNSFDRRLETFLAAIHPPDLPDHQAAMRDAWNGSQPLDRILRIRRRDGDLRWIHVQGRLDSTPSATPRLIGIVRDITDQRLLQDQLWSARKLEAIGRLAAGIAHDFNNLMTVVRANADMALAEDGLHDSTREHLTEVLEASRRASELTGRLLAFGRRQQPALAPVDLNAVVGGLVNMLRRLVADPIRIHLEPAPSLPPALADAGMLEQIVLNLVVNARDALPAGGDIFLRTSVAVPPPQCVLPEESASADTDGNLSPTSTSPPGPTGPFACLEVTDNGTGIPPENLPRLFEPFFTTKEAGHGSGLGLASVYGIVRQHRGGVQVTSRLGEGTTFRIFIPLAPPSAEAIPSPVEGTFPNGGVETILVVEDEAEVRLATRRMLGRFGYRLIEAPNAAEALRAWDECSVRIDLVLTDLRMPGDLSGEQLAARLRNLRPDLKVVFTSGHGLVPDSPLREEPGVHFLPKPYDLPQLARIVRQALDS